MSTNDTQWRECIRTIVLQPHVNGPANPDNRKRLERMLYLYGFSEPHYQVPMIRQCYCGYTLEQHRDMLPCDNLGLLNY